MSAWPIERRHVGERECLDGERAERVAEVVEAEPLQPGPVECLVEAAAEPPVVDVPADLVDEHEVVVACEPLAAAEAVEGLRSLMNQRHRPHLPRLRRALGEDATSITATFLRVTVVL